MNLDKEEIENISFNPEKNIFYTSKNLELNSIELKRDISIIKQSNNTISFINDDEVDKNEIINLLNIINESIQINLEKYEYEYYIYIQKLKKLKAKPKTTYYCKRFTEFNNISNKPKVVSMVGKVLYNKFTDVNNKKNNNCDYLNTNIEQPTTCIESKDSMK
jgi:hypothetical protein